MERAGGRRRQLLPPESPHCLRRLVIRADAEFGAVPPANDRKIAKKLREFNAFLTGSSSRYIVKG